MIYINREDFWGKIENKYNIGLKKDRGIILRFDGRNITKDKSINLLDETSGFSYALKQVAKELSLKYSYLYIYIATDEINIMILDTDKLLKNMKSNYAQEIVTTFGQEISYIFHKYYKDRFIIFAGRAFSVYQDNYPSYLIYRKHTNKSVLTTYFLKRRNITVHNKNFTEKEAEAIKFDDYNNRTLYQSEGIIYYRGKEIGVETVLKEGIENLSKTMKVSLINESIIKDDL